MENAGTYGDKSIAHAGYTFPYQTAASARRADPVWYDLCDEYGILVMDEANIESHANYATICRDPRWKND